jgi:hypothetical protein
MSIISAVGIIARKLAVYGFSHCLDPERTVMTLDASRLPS